MCLVGFASLQSPCAHTLKASLPCLPLPLHRILSSSQPLQMNNNPSLRTTTLASLVKGRWIDGKAQTVALLHFYLRYIRLFYSPNFLPSRRRDCHTTISRLHQPSRTRTILCFAPTPLLLNERSVGFASALSPRSSPTLPKPHYPTLSTTFLAPLPKGAGLRQGYFLL